MLHIELLCMDRERAVDTDWFNEHFTGRRHVELIRTKSYNPISANGREVFPFTMSVAYHPLHIQQNTSNKYLSFDIISNIKIYADVFEHSENSWSPFLPRPCSSNICHATHSQRNPIKFNNTLSSLYIHKNT